MSKEKLLFGLIALALFVTLISSCKKDDNPVGANPPIGDSYIWPLKLGNVWIYKITEYDTAGIIIQARFDTTKILRDTTISNEKWYQLSESRYFLTNRTNGLWALDLSLPSPSPELLLKYPGLVGDGWNYRVPGGGPDSLRVTIVSTSTPITVPAGNYSCYFYRFTEQSLPTRAKSEDYFAPNVGPVLEEYFESTTSGSLYKKRRLELISYTLL